MHIKPSDINRRDLYVPLTALTPMYPTIRETGPSRLNASTTLVLSGPPTTIEPRVAPVAGRIFQTEGKPAMSPTATSCGAARTARAECAGLPSPRGYTQTLARSTNGKITGDFQQAPLLFMKDGGHGIVFRNRKDRLLMTLHSPQQQAGGTALFLRGGRKGRPPDPKIIEVIL